MKHYPHYLIDLSRELRKDATPAEQLLWERLRNKKLAGLNSNINIILNDRYIADFYCAELQLVVELEGGVHDKKDQREYDEYKFAYLEARGLNVLRFRNEDVINNIEKVLKIILHFKNLHPQPLSQFGRGSMMH